MNFEYAQSMKEEAN